jgi:ribulose-5-phosphate 4-epimerase/fuculose-1-phosphate aldolase
LDPTDLDALRIELCCGMRLLSRRGATAPFIAGHASVKIDDDRLLVNRFGVSFETVTPADLLVIDLGGNVLEGRGRVNQTIRLHCSIHEKSAGAKAAVHSHPPSVVTFSTLAIPPLIYDQESCALAGSIALLDKKHDSLDTSPIVAEEFAGRPEINAIIAPNHGAFTRGPSMAAAFYFFLVLEHICRRNLAILEAGRAAGVRPQAIDADVAREIQTEQRELKALPDLWNDALDSLRATDPQLLAERDRVNPRPH